jgi:dihydropteroate synthase
MTGLPIPEPRLGPRTSKALDLAGSRFVWFDRTMDAQGVVHPASELTGEGLRALVHPAPVLCGLALDRPRIMGIVNVTPDSFSDGGDAATVATALAWVREMDGADILDIGGESTRPGAEWVPVATEIDRVVPVIRAIREAGILTPISIDTRKAEVARAALAAGADMVNDVSAFRHDPELAQVVAEARVPVCLMHSLGDPATMQHDPQYYDVLSEVRDHLAERVDFALAAGIARDSIVVDPGIGFGKTLDHNMTLLRGLAQFHGLGLPLLLGVSRKRFIGTIGGGETPKGRMPGSLALALHGAAMGVQILRVHDVAQTRQALALWQALWTKDNE